MAATAATASCSPTSPGRRPIPRSRATTGDDRGAGQRQAARHARPAARRRERARPRRPRWPCRRWRAARRQARRARSSSCPTASSTSSREARREMALTSRSASGRVRLRAVRSGLSRPRLRHAAAGIRLRLGAALRRSARRPGQRRVAGDQGRADRRADRPEARDRRCATRSTRPASRPRSAICCTRRCGRLPPDLGIQTQGWHARRGRRLRDLSS